MINGFKQSGLWPHGRNTVRVEKCITQVEKLADGDENTAIAAGPETPQKGLQQAIVQAIASQPSENTKKAVEVAKKCKRAQVKEGKILTTPERLQRLQILTTPVLKRFQEEAMAWQAKKQNSSNKCCKDLVGILKDNEHEDNEISEDEDDTA